MLRIRRLVPAIALWLIGTGSAQAIDMPSSREGLWERHWVTTMTPGNEKTDTTVQLCRDHALDKAAWEASRKIPGCTFVKENLSGANYTAEIHCVIGAMTLQETASGVYRDTSTHTEMHVHYTPSLEGKTDESDVTDFRYLGSCPANMKPGDMKRQDGTIQH